MAAMVATTVTVTTTVTTTATTRYPTVAHGKHTFLGCLEYVRHAEFPRQEAPAPQLQ